MIEKDRLPHKQWMVYSIIQSFGPISARKIADKLHWEINQVVGRISEIKDMALIREAGSRENAITQRDNTLYEIVPPWEIEQVLKNRKQELTREFDELYEDSLKELSHGTMQMINNKIKSKLKRIKIIASL